jgi:hypothetical protein
MENKFIILTVLETNKKTCVRLENIKSFEETSKEECNYCLVEFYDSPRVKVKETFDEIVGKIKRAFDYSI